MGIDEGARAESIEHFAADLPRLLSFELTNGETAEVVEHLRGCDACRKELVEAVAAQYPPEATLPRWYTAEPEPVPKTTPRRSSIRRLRSAAGPAKASRIRRFIALLLVLLFIVILSVIRSCTRTSHPYSGRSSAVAPISNVGPVS
ncbi:zf-HC2 domain-containing protein [Actinoallomurus sp. CA-150999]|uniref:zf-HC2 domain-containing protein n=1 Tax=Actinoallomurus sp. CA-150999 TaxID=3239887 RepID=UPI003D943261